MFGAELRGANLQCVNLSNAWLRSVNLEDADLRHAILDRADLSAAGLVGADFEGASLVEARFHATQLRGANLSNADLILADLRYENLNRANFTGTTLRGTIFAHVDLREAIGLDNCDHLGPSIIDFITLQISRDLPLSFLRGCGLPDIVIDYLPSLRGEAIQFYSCFISYSSKDQLFVERLHADLQNKGVRCWFAPHDLPIGAKTWDAIDEAIRLRDKLLLILSKASIASEWVEDEVNKAYAEERSRKEVVLFPIRIDNAVMTTPEPWAVKLREQRNIGDFRQWKKPAEYQKSLERLLRDLKASGAK